MFRILAALFAALCAFGAPPSVDSQGLSRFLSESVNRGDVPAVVVLVTGRNGVLYHEAFGKAQKNSIFGIASMTKPITSTAVMMLVEEGKIGLDDPISKYLPVFASPQVIAKVDLKAGTYETRPAKRPITIRHLLTNTSGIGYSWCDPGLTMIAEKTKRSSETELPLVNDPGEQWTYGPSTKILGDLVEKLSCETLVQFFDARIFGPLGMQETAYVVPEGKRDRVVPVFQKKSGEMTALPTPKRWASRPRGDGGLYSTAADYGKFVQMFLNGGEAGSARLLKAETVRLMDSNQTGTVKVRLQPVPDAMSDFAKPFPLGAGEDVWGLGFQLAAPSHPNPRMRRAGSMSWAGINNTYFWIDPKAQIGVVVLMHMLPFYDEKALDVLRGVETHVYEHLRP